MIKLSQNFIQFQRKNKTSCSQNKEDNNIHNSEAKQMRQKLTLNDIWY